MTTYVCADKDIICGDRPANWCAACPKRGPAMTAPTDAIEPCPELNLSNYNEDDVAALNDWAVRASALIEQMQAAPANEAAFYFATHDEVTPREGNEPRVLKAEHVESYLAAGWKVKPALTAVCPQCETTQAAPQPEQVGLTDAEIDALWLYQTNLYGGDNLPQIRALVRAAIEAALKGKTK